MLKIIYKEQNEDERVGNREVDFLEMQKGICERGEKGREGRRELK